MMSRCDQNFFKPSPSTQCLRMNKEGIESMNHQKCGDHDCGKTNQWQYAPEHASYQCLEYCYPCRHGIIKIFALVMYHMSGPKNIDLVCKPMIPIPYKVSSKKKENPGNSVRFNIQNC